MFAVEPGAASESRSDRSLISHDLSGESGQRESAFTVSEFRGQCGSVSENGHGRTSDASVERMEEQTAAPRETIAASGLGFTTPSARGDQAGCRVA